MQKVIVADPIKCTGCRICEMVCSIKKEGVNNPTRARIQVIKWDAAALSMPIVCQQCQDPPCLAVCPVNALSRDENLGVVNLAQDVCIGCKACVASCPFGAIGIDTKADRITKCDLCEGDPTCVKFCDTGAIQFLTASTLNLRKKRESAQKFSELLQRNTAA